MSYNIDSLTDDCYKGTTCLINKFNIQDERQLELIESQITLAKISMLLKNPLNGNFDFSHYKAIHKFIFEDLYDWAGNIRNINLSKKGTTFAESKNIERLAKACFDRLKDNNYFKGLDFNRFVDEITDFYIITNNLHQFREGNGRTQRVFLSQLITNAGYTIDFYNIDADELMIATIHSANGIDTYLKDIFRKNIKKI